ncbi:MULTISPECIES: hypothetical protein [unclassified Sphingomonas]|jgi:hypothetical protein|uniref:hypothetical protein n=1 Tax=unclassified Sphingomonas TaxID=196159 RepID=UPI000E105C23|nr:MULTISPECIES: hypothetical protein [unclassified Sphingomonas]AXJ94531.1 hypothetical protein DM480_02530 [Sphingomonas sp. FARSPH]
MVIVQIACVVAIMALLAIAPRSDGALLLVPIGPAGEMARVAVAHGATLLGPGPGSTLIVRGRWAVLQMALLEQGGIVIGAPSAWCGAKTARGEKA